MRALILAACLCTALSAHAQDDRDLGDILADISAINIQGQCNAPPAGSGPMTLLGVAMAGGISAGVRTLNAGHPDNAPLLQQAAQIRAAQARWLDDNVPAYAAVLIRDAHPGITWVRLGIAQAPQEREGQLRAAISAGRPEEEIRDLQRGFVEAAQSASAMDQYEAAYLAAMSKFGAQLAALDAVAAKLCG